MKQVLTLITASSFWMLLNGRRANAAELLYGMQALLCSPPKMFYSSFDRKIVKMLPRFYLTLGIIIPVSSEIFWPAFLYNLTLHRLLEISRSSCYDLQGKAFWNIILKVQPRRRQVSSSAPSQKPNCYINILRRGGKQLSCPLTLPSVISLTVLSFNTGNFKYNYFQLPII